MEQKEPFLKNFVVMENLMRDYFGTYNWNGMKTCEIGAGRGTISDMLNMRGCKTFCSDLKDRLKYQDHYYEDCDIRYDTPFQKEGGFDLVFTYGLLEHFDSDTRWSTMMRMEDMLKPGGMFIHYVVPKKFTNIFEDRSVPRHPCNEWRMGGTDFIDVTYVYPVLNLDSWITNEFLSKGFFISKRRNGEGTSFNNS